MMPENPLDRLRSLCLALPETTERLSHGEPTWFVRGKKTFVMFADHHHDDVTAFWCAAPPGAQDLLIEADPARYFRPPYVGHRGWLGVRLDVEPDWNEIAGLVHDAYRAVAPARLVQALDAQSSRKADRGSFTGQPRPARHAAVAGDPGPAPAPRPGGC